MTVYPISEAFIEAVLDGCDVNMAEGAEQPDAMALCRGYGVCPYANSCPERPKRMQWEERQGKSRRVNLN